VLPVPTHQPDLASAKNLHASSADHVTFSHWLSFGSRTPCKGRNKPASEKAANRAHAQLKTWRILRKLRCCP
jgi:hypothetical protein